MEDCDSERLVQSSEDDALRTKPRAAKLCVVQRHASIRSAFDLDVQDIDLRRALSTALDAIDVVHAGPDGLPRIPIRDILGRRLLGGYRWVGSGTAFDILVSSDGDDPAFTLVHEVGHYLDHQALGVALGTFASAAGELCELLDSLEMTDAVRELRRLERQAPIALSDVGGLAVILDDDDFAYLLEPEELFARSYAQYLAVRSGDPTLLRDLLAAQRIVYPQQWKDRDFEAVAAAFDEVLEALGWSGS